MIDVSADSLPKIGIRQDLSDSKGSISSSVANYGIFFEASASVYHEAVEPAETRAINTSVRKVTCTVDEISSGMDDGCNEVGSCYGSAIEYSDNSDSEHEIFRVKRRSTTIANQLLTRGYQTCLNNRF
jgi:hypothetical protein